MSTHIPQPKSYKHFSSRKRKALRDAIQAHDRHESNLTMPQIAKQFGLALSSLGYVAVRVRFKQTRGNACVLCGIRHKYLDCERNVCDECYYERVTTPTELAAARRLDERGF